MAKFRKKPVVIEAVQLGWDTWDEICTFVGVPENGHGCWVNPDGTAHDEPLVNAQPGQRMGMIIHTLEGDMLAWEGDWIIKGVKGEFYPCKPEIFDMTYETVAD